MDWIRHAIWWHVYPLGFVGAPIREPDRQPGARLRRLLPWLDHAVGLGASGLLLGPVFASQTHGYDTLDHYSIDPRLGDDQDFDELVEQCRQRGLRVVLDGVFSHVGDRHPAYLCALEQGPGSRDADLFDIDWEAGRARVFEGHGSLVRLNHTSSQAVDYTAGVMRHWLNRGIDGWRLDAAYSVPHEFWAGVVPQVRSAHPDAWLLGEVIHGDYATFVAASGFDSVTQYELWKAIWSSISDGNLYELEWAMRRHNDFLDAFIPNTFVGNHDVTRISTTLGPDGAITALAILLTLGGIPSIYAGDEHGYTGVKQERIGGDDEVRPPFPDSPADLAAWGLPTQRAHQDLIGLRRRHPWLVHARTTTTELDNTYFGYRSSDPDGSDFIDVVVDLRETPQAVVRDSAGAVLWAQSQ